MKIKSLHLRDGISQKLYPFDDVTVIVSQHNKAGKTTLLRCILYALGYPIPSMRGMHFERMEFSLSAILGNGSEISLNRNGSVLELLSDGETKRFSLPVDQNALHKIVFGIDGETVLDNLLGTWYLDQDKGWTLLNRGKVIGNVHFTIEDFLRGLTGRPCTQEREKAKAISEEIRKYQHMLKVAEYQVELTESGDAVPHDTPAEEIMKEILRLRNERKPLEVESRRLQKAVKSNDDFCKYINSMQLRVKGPDGITIPVNTETVVDLADMRDLLAAKLENVKFQIAKIDNAIGTLESRQTENNILAQVETSIQRFAEELNHISIDVPAVERILRSLHQQQSVLQETIQKALVQEQSAVKFLTDSIVAYLREFGIDEAFGHDIFTSDLKSLSGTIFHLQVFAFKISYVKLVREKTGCILPLIIDSPHGREVEKDLVDKMIKVLLRDFSDHQIIIATIYDPCLPNQKTIELINGVVGFETMGSEN